MNSIITGIGYTFPETAISSKEIETKISQTYPDISFGIIEEMTGVQSRYFAGDNEYPSDLATKASTIALQKSGLKKTSIDLLIFASASQDITEPATANIIQKNLGLTCPVFDIKNACNSFMNGLEIADSFLQTGKYKNIIICSGETPSRAIRFDVKTREEFKGHFAGYTLGDAGCAVVLSGVSSEALTGISSEMSGKKNETPRFKGIKKSLFFSDGSDWELATIMGGGSRFPRDFSKSYFSGNPAKIRDKFLNMETDQYHAGLKEIGWKQEEIKKVFVHQVTMSNFEHLQKSLGIPREKFKVILPKVGNIASCCIVTSLAQAFEENELHPGDKILLLGFASGFSYGILYYEV